MDATLSAQRGEMHGLNCEECGTRHGDTPPGKTAPAILTPNGFGRKRARLLCQFCASDLVRRIQQNPGFKAPPVRRRTARPLPGPGVKQVDLFKPARKARKKAGSKA